MRRLTVTLALLLHAAVAMAAGITERMTLPEAIAAVTAEGFDIAYSSKLVRPWMRVQDAPETADPLAALEQVLATHGLGLKRGGENRWLVVRRQRPVIVTEPTAVTPTAKPVVLPPLEVVTVVASRHSLFNRHDSAEQFLSAQDIQLMPHLSDDAFRAFHRLPGVAANDFSAPFHLRGGTVEEVKFLLDGLDIIEPYHMRTLFKPLSIVDPGIIGQAEVYSGGFAADYGNHISGVVDIESRLPESWPVHEVGVSFVSSFARSYGLFASGRGSYQVSARRGYLDLLAKTSEDEGEELVPRYSDFFGRMSYTVGNVIDVAAQALVASDTVRFTDVANGRALQDRNDFAHAWLTVDIVPSDELSSRSVLFHGRIETREGGGAVNPPLEDIRRDYARDLATTGLRSDLRWRASATQLWKFGVQLRRLRADYDYFLDSVRGNWVGPFLVSTIILRDIETSRDGHETGAHVTWRWQPMPSAVWEIGVRWDRQSYADGNDEGQVSPRASAIYRLGEHTDLRVGWGRYYQPHGIQDLQVEDGVTEFYPAEEAEHRVAGIRHRFASGVELQLDAYEKRYHELYPRFENALDNFEFAPESLFDRVRVDPQRALTRGVEATVKRRRSRGFDWWVNYTWSRAHDEIEGHEVPRSWDQRHALTASAGWRGERWSLNAIARYHSGWPQTRIGIVPAFDAAGDLTGIATDFAQRNDNRYDDYSRVDIRLSRAVRLRRSELDVYFEIYNLFDTTNPCCVNGHDVTISTGIAASPVYDDYLHFFPSFGFVWRFGPGLAGGES